MAKQEIPVTFIRSKGHHLVGSQALGDGEVAEVPEPLAKRQLALGHAETATADEFKEYAARVADETATGKKKPETRGGK